MIYAIQILEGKYIKVGYSDRETSQSRIASMQTGCPFEMEELFCTSGTLKQEKEIHSALRDAFARIRIPIPPNEWYPGNGDFFQRFLDELKHGPNNALAFCDRYNQNVKQPGKGETSLEPNIKWPKLKKYG